MSIKIKFGSIAGLLAGFWFISQNFLGLYLTNFTKFNLLIIFLLLFVSIYFSIVKTRDNEKGGFIEYRPAAGIGVTVSLLFSFILALFTYLFYKLNPENIEIVLDSQEKFFLSEGKSLQEIAVNRDYLRQNFAFSEGFTSFLSISIIGFIFSLLAAILLRRESK